jgi:hypothetical protein
MENYLFIPTKITEILDKILKIHNQDITQYLSRRETNNDFHFLELKDKLPIVMDILHIVLDMLNIEFKNLLGVEKNR